MLKIEVSKSGDTTCIHLDRALYMSTTLEQTAQYIAHRMADKWLEADLIMYGVKVRAGTPCASYKRYAS